MDCTTGSAPGRLDVLGGVADYSGALVLEMPTRQSIDVVAEADDALVVGPAVLSVAEMARLAELEYVDVRRALEGLPRWTHYLIGVAVVLVRHGIIPPPRVRLRISSDLPQSMGVASSAALEVATARALGAGVIDPLHVGLACARRRRTSWSARRAASWTKWRWRSDLPVPCCRFSAAPRHPGPP